MLKNNGILIGKGENSDCILPFSMANRHGLIAGATGSGKTVSMKLLAEGFSDAGIPVFITDIKGDVSSMTRPGSASANTEQRLQANGIDPDTFAFQGYPVRFLDVFGRQGTPVRAAISSLGPLFLSRLLELSSAQSGVLNVVFAAADDRGWEIYDLEDLKAMILWCADHASELEASYGHIAKQSASALVRRLTELENQDGNLFLGKPDFSTASLFEKRDGKGLITLLECSTLFLQPLLYSTVILWLLSDLYESLPEAGDLDQPRIAVFIDEAHLLFDGLPKTMTEKIIQIVRLIRSKGASLFFVSQSPSDLPDALLSQLASRIQHSLHAYTPAEMKKVRAAAQGFRPNPAFSAQEAMQALKTGEALVSLPNEDGEPEIVQKVLVLPPQSSFDALSAAQMDAQARMDPLDQTLRSRQDPYSAAEKIEQVRRQEQIKIEQEKQQKEWQKQQAREEKAAMQRQARSRQSDPLKKAARSAARAAGRDAGQAIARGLMSNSSKSARRAASQAAGSLLSDLFASFFQ